MMNLLNKSNCLAEKKIQILIFLTCIIIYSFAEQYESSMINNGDYWRASKSMFIDLKPWVKMEDCYPFQETSLKKFFPISLIGVLGFFIFILHQLFNQDCFHTQSIFFALSFIYFSGLICLVVQYKTTVLQLIVLFLSYLLFSFFFKSLYEEAIILALGPWLIFSIFQVCYQKNIFSFVLVTCLILVSKAQMVFILPLIMTSIFSVKSICQIKKIQTTLILLIIILSALTSVLIKGHYFEDENAYNRIFNGIGWSLQNVSDWPASTLKERINYYNKNKGKLSLLSKEYEPLSDYDLLGTTFWTTGKNFFESSDIKHSTQVIKQLSTLKFIHFFINHPSFLDTYIKNIFSITISSNYSLDSYRITSNIQYHNVFNSITSSLLAYFGFIYILIGFISIIYFKEINLRIACTYFFIGSPLFVVIADGYFEFEKHMFCYFMLTPFFLLSLLICQHYLLTPAPAIKSE